MMWHRCFRGACAGVGIDMGKAVTLREVVEPRCDAVLIHPISVILGKDIAVVDPPFSVGDL